MTAGAPPGTVPAPRLPAVHRDAVAGAGLTASTGGGGLLIGTDEAGAPVPLVLFRPEPTSAVCVGGLALAQRLVLRALALRARVVVESSRPSAWQAFARLAAGTSGLVTVLEQRGGESAPPSPAPGEHPTDELAGTPEAPRLLVLDHDAAAAGEPRRLGRWSAVLTCVDGASEWSQAALAGADVIVSRALSGAEVRRLARALNLEETALRVPPTGDRLLVAARAGAVVVRHSVTSVEQWLTAASGAPS
ncbi:hypothetical protein [Blastococcus sp. TF02A-26]|uniref:hypothetical protein n=1 Tax=Blastococcus sp. TF02A-26 TaxID=2250577 RepID=UPI000DE81CCC|nr:hypothetical protein [Blastococcus sp. TF02A-26]RBY86117.1 hypothetical protein DQ240_09905 [Blastococcus sp. TF02A-26]